MVAIFCSQIVISANSETEFMYLFLTFFILPFSKQMKYSVDQIFRCLFLWVVQSQKKSSLA